MSKRENRRKPGGRIPTATTANHKRSRWLTCGRWLFFASGWVVAAFVGVLELPAKIVSFSENYAPAKETTLNAAIDYQKYVGRFSSDPDAWVGRNLVSEDALPPDVGDIQFDIEYIGHGEYRGEVRSAYLAKSSIAPWSRVMIDGKVGLTGTFQGVVWVFLTAAARPTRRSACLQRMNRVDAFDLRQYLRTTFSLAKLCCGQLVLRCREANAGNRWAIIFTRSSPVLQSARVKSRSMLERPLLTVIGHRQDRGAVIAIGDEFSGSAGPRGNRQQLPVPCVADLTRP